MVKDVAIITKKGDKKLDVMVEDIENAEENVDGAGD